jgi:tetratricopeptide (TPR) repeat protein
MKGTHVFDSSFAPLTRRVFRVLAAAGLFALTACGGGAETGTGGAKTPGVGAKGNGTPLQEMSKDSQAKYNTSLDAFVDHDKKNDWTDDVCKDVASQFEGVGRNAQALFNAGLAYQRCGDDKNARARFEQSLAADPKFHHARAQLALYQYKADSNEDSAITSLQQAVTDAQFQNVPALVDLAMVQMARDGAQSGDQCKDDMDCAKRNLQRALAIDDAYMPAFNQLALYYFKLAKKRAGAVSGTSKTGKGRQVVTNASMGKRADVQQLELAALVCSQAIRKNANYAPIHNTAGLIQNELGQVNGAVSEFAAAAKLDPKFFEAQMNFAAVNLGFRGFEQASAAYKKALVMRPNDYDAHLGLALALRGPITGAETNYDQLVAAAQAELDAAKKIDPNRPDAYYNEGILTQEFKAKAGGDKAKTIASLEQAKQIFQQFLEKAAGKPEYDGAVKRVKGDGTPKDGGRIQDINDTIQFLNLNANEQKNQQNSGNTQ